MLCFVLINSVLLNLLHVPNQQHFFVFLFVWLVESVYDLVCSKLIFQSHKNTAHCECCHFVSDCTWLRFPDPKQGFGLWHQMFIKLHFSGVDWYPHQWFSGHQHPDSFIYLYNTCWTPHPEMSSKHLKKATIAQFSASEQSVSWGSNQSVTQQTHLVATNLEHRFPAEHHQVCAHKYNSNPAWSGSGSCSSSWSQQWWQWALCCEAVHTVCMLGGSPHQSTDEGSEDSRRMQWVLKRKAQLGTTVLSKKQR